MVHEAMVLEYSGRHLALIDLASDSSCCSTFRSSAACSCPGACAGAGRERRARIAIGVVRTSAKLARRRRAAGPVRDGHRQDARVPRAGLPRRRLDARSAGHAAALRVAGAYRCTASISTSPICSPAPGAGELHAALPGPALRAAQHLCAACAGAALPRSPGRPSSRTRRISTSPRLIALVFKAIIIPVALHRIIVQARHPPRDRDRRRRRPRHAGGHRAGRAVHGGDAARHRRRRSAGARGFGLRAVGGAARPADDGDAAQRGRARWSASCRWKTAWCWRRPAPRACRWWSRSRVAFSVLIAFIVIGIFLFRIRERFDTVDMQALDRFRGERR